MFKEQTLVSDVTMKKEGAYVVPAVKETPLKATLLGNAMTFLLVSKKKCTLSTNEDSSIFQLSSEFY